MFLVVFLNIIAYLYRDRYCPTPNFVSYTLKLLVNHFFEDRRCIQEHFHFLIEFKKFG